MIVSMKYCEEYDFERLRTIINESVIALGGWDKFVTKGDRILVKPNLLSKKRPDDAVTTHPMVVKALCSWLIEKGAYVVIGDSPGGLFTSVLLSGIYKTTGMEAVANDTGAALNRNFESFMADNPRGVIMKKLSLTDMINDVDKIICVAKLKTHGMMTYTGAVKNMFGVVPGVTKAEYHLNIPDYERFADALVDVCLAAEPILTIMDGIVGMEGNGPAAGNPVHTGAILASESPYHLDMVACKLVGINQKDVPMLRRMIARGIVAEDLSDIELVGEPYERFKKRDYDIPPIGSNLMNLNDPRVPQFMKNFIRRHVQTRPLFDKELCNGCGVCLEACPAKIMEIKDGCATVDSKDCIRCYCCQELCPKKAISIYKPTLSRVLRL